MTTTHKFPPQDGRRPERGWIPALGAGRLIKPKVGLGAGRRHEVGSGAGGQLRLASEARAEIPQGKPK